MSFLDNLMFWKKKDNFDFAQDANSGFGTAGLGGTGLNSNYGDLGMDTGQGYDSPGFRQNQGDEFARTSQQFQYPQPSIPQAPFMQSSPLNNSNPQQSGYIVNKDMEVISSKLDAIKAVLDAINQRLTTLERNTSGEYEPRRRNW